MENLNMDSFLKAWLLFADDGSGGTFSGAMIFIGILGGKFFEGAAFSADLILFLPRTQFFLSLWVCDAIFDDRCRSVRMRTFFAVAVSCF